MRDSGYDAHPCRRISSWGSRRFDRRRISGRRPRRRGTQVASRPSHAAEAIFGARRRGARRSWTPPMRPCPSGSLRTSRHARHRPRNPRFESDRSRGPRGRGAAREVAARHGVARLGAGALDAFHLAGQVDQQLGGAAILEPGAGPADHPAGLVGDPDACGARLDRLEALLRRLERANDRARKQPVQQQEFGRVDVVGRRRGRCAGTPGRRHTTAAGASTDGPPAMAASRPAARSCRRARGCGRARGTASRRRGSSSSRRCR